MRSDHAPWAAALLACCALGLASEAAAQTEPREDSAARDEARELFRQGRQLFQRDRPEEAIELLQRSYELFPSWAASNGLALCEEKLGRMQPALVLYERALAEGGTEIPEAQRTQLEQRIQELRRSLNVAHLSVTTVPAGAQVTYDGAPLGTTPFAQYVPAGAHTLDLALDGYESSGRSLSLTAGEARVLDVTLVALADTTPVGPTTGRTGLLAVTADHEGQPVFVDGARVGTTPLAPTAVPEGERLVRVEADGRVWEERLQVTADETVRVDLTLGRRGVAQGWFWGLAATAAAAGIGCAATGGYALSLQSEYDGATPERKNELVPTGQLMMDVTDALVGVAGATALTALILAFFTDFGGEPEASITLGGTTEEGVGDATAANRALVW